MNPFLIDCCYIWSDLIPRVVTDSNQSDATPIEVLIENFIGGLRLNSPNPDPISGQHMQFFCTLFQNWPLKIYFQTKIDKLYTLFQTKTA